MSWLENFWSINFKESLLAMWWSNAAAILMFMFWPPQRVKIQGYFSNFRWQRLQKLQNSTGHFIGATVAGCLVPQIVEPVIRRRLLVDSQIVSTKSSFIVHKGNIATRGVEHCLHVKCGTVICVVSRSAGFLHSLRFLCAGVTLAMRIVDFFKELKQFRGLILL